jgi:hypothetical protein
VENKIPSTSLVTYWIRHCVFMSRRLRGLDFIVIVSLAIAVASCDSGMNDIAVENGTDRVLILSEVFDGQDFDEQRLEPGQTARFDSSVGEAGPFRVRDDTGSSVMSIVSLTTTNPRYEITEEALEPNVVNDTGLTLELVEDRGSSRRAEFEMATLEPGEGHAAATPGTVCFGPLVVKSLDGKVFAEMDEAFCPGDRWIIGEPGASG